MLSFLNQWPLLIPCFYFLKKFTFYPFWWFLSHYHLLLFHQLLSLLGLVYRRRYFLWIRNAFHDMKISFKMIVLLRFVNIFQGFFFNAKINKIIDVCLSWEGYCATIYLLYNFVYYLVSLLSWNLSYCFERLSFIVVDK